MAVSARKPVNLLPARGFVEQLSIRGNSSPGWTSQPKSRLLFRKRHSLRLGVLDQVVHAIGYEAPILVRGPVAHVVPHGKPHYLRLSLRAEPHHDGLCVALNTLDEGDDAIGDVDVVVELGVAGGEFLGEILGGGMVANYFFFFYVRIPI